jgi:hypothetical protein
MQFLRIALVLLAAAAAAGQYLQERYRLTVIQRLPPAEARARTEALRRRSERGMTVLAVIAGLAGAVALFDLLTGSGGR